MYDHDATPLSCTTIVSDRASDMTLSIIDVYGPI